MSTVADSNVYAIVGLGAALGGWLGKTWVFRVNEKARASKSDHEGVLQNSNQAWVFVNQTIDRQSKMIDQLEDDKRRQEVEIQKLNALIVDLRTALTAAQADIIELQRKRVKNA